MRQTAGCKEYNDMTFGLIGGKWDSNPALILQSLFPSHCEAASSELLRRGRQNVKVLSPSVASLAQTFSSSLFIQDSGLSLGALQKHGA